MHEWQTAGGWEAVLEQELCVLHSFLHPLLMMAGDDDHASWNYCLTLQGPFLMHSPC